MEQNNIIIKDEKWHQIKDFPNYYISNYGRIKNKQGRFLSPVITPKGYLCVSLYGDKTKKGFRIHRLVAMYFVEGYNEQIEVHHKDKNPQNNKADNLLCLTPQEHLLLHSKEKKNNE